MDGLTNVVPAAAELKHAKVDQESVNKALAHVRTFEHITLWKFHSISTLGDQLFILFDDGSGL